MRTRLRLRHKGPVVTDLKVIDHSRMHDALARFGEITFTPLAHVSRSRWLWLQSHTLSRALIGHDPGVRAGFSRQWMGARHAAWLRDEKVEELQRNNPHHGAALTDS